MLRKSVRVELNKRHVVHIMNALNAYLEHEDISPIVNKNIDEIKKLRRRFEEHFKSFDRNW